MQELKLSLALTTFNRYELLLKSFADVINHRLVDEVVIVDDKSEPEYWDKVKHLSFYHPKIKVLQNPVNIGMSANKAEAVRQCANEWVILLDSDNILTNEYLNSIPSFLDPQAIYMPEFARPNFDFRAYAGMTFHKSTVGKMDKKGDFWVMLNTCNYMLPKNLYLSVYKENKEIKETDTLWFAYLWLKAGYYMHVLRGMQYDHLVHKDSGWLRHQDYNLKMHNNIKKLILDLCP